VETLNSIQHKQNNRIPIVIIALVFGFAIGFGAGLYYAKVERNQPFVTVHDSPVIDKASSRYSENSSEPSVQESKDDKNFEIVDINTRITEKNDVYWQFAWRLTVKNNLSRQIVLNGKIEFHDKDGFIVDDDYVRNLVLDANSQDTFTGKDMIDSSIAPNVAGVMAKLKGERLF
jgi:hypothetical protein